MCARETLVGFPLRVQSKAALARPGFLHCKKPRAEEHAKKITTRKGGDFCDCPQVLLPALPHIARKGECEGETFAGFPTRVQSPARRRPILRSKIAAPKKYDHPKGGRIFLERATRLELASRHPANGITIRRNPASPLNLTRFAQVEAASSTLPAAFQKEKPPKGWFSFLEQGTGVEPALTAWEAAVIPIYQPCIHFTGLL